MDPSGDTPEWTPGTDQRRSPPSPRPRSAHPGSRAPFAASFYGSIDSGVSHPPRTESKRKRRVDITWSEFDDFGKDGDESKARKQAREEEADVKKLSCPFRRHGSTEFQCPRCYDEFATETALRDHQRADNPCEKKPVSDRISVQQERQLRSQWLHEKCVTVEERWNAMYKILFPDHKAIPSPDFEPKLPSYSSNLVRTDVENIALSSEILKWLESHVPVALEPRCIDKFGSYEEE